MASDIKLRAVQQLREFVRFYCGFVRWREPSSQKRTLTTPNDQFPNPNHFQRPHPNDLLTLLHWELGVGSGWELEVGDWELIT
jgi:hypothetical protein